MLIFSMLAWTSTAHAGLLDGSPTTDLETVAGIDLQALAPATSPWVVQLQHKGSASQDALGYAPAAMFIRPGSSRSLLGRVQAGVSTSGFESLSVMGGAELSVIKQEGGTGFGLSVTPLALVQIQQTAALPIPVLAVTGMWNRVSLDVDAALPLVIAYDGGWQGLAAASPSGTLGYKFGSSGFRGGLGVGSSWAPSGEWSAPDLTGSLRYQRGRITTVATLSGDTDGAFSGSVELRHVLP